MKPFIIVAPKYVANSNGIKTLYKIAHTINQLGGDARMLFVGNDPDVQEIGLRDITWTNLEWNTPALQGSDTHLIETAYVMYSETILGNPLNAKNVIRYFGNREGYCNGKMIGIEPNDFLLAHSRATRKDAHYILFNSEISPFFHAEGSIPTLERKIDATYIGKGHLYGKTIVPEKTILIERDWPKSQEQLALFLRNVRCFYTWDSWTQTNVEAVLCGAIPFFLRYEPWTEEDLDGNELGYIPRMDVNKPSVDIKAFDAARLALKARAASLAATWEQRVYNFTQMAAQHFAERTSSAKQDDGQRYG